MEDGEISLDHKRDVGYLQNIRRKGLLVLTKFKIQQ